MVTSRSASTQAEQRKRSGVGFGFPSRFSLKTDLTLLGYTLTRRFLPMCLTFTLTLLGCFTLANGQSLVIGSPEPIVAFLGEDVVLPCHLEPAYDVKELTIEWMRDDLQPEYVHLYRHGREIPDMKVASYDGRTFLFADGLRRGNISLKIANVTLTDQGIYRCTIPKLQGPSKMSDVQLVVELKSMETWTTETPLLPPNLQTPEPKVKGGRTRLVAWIVPAASCVVLILSVLAVILKCQKQSARQKPVKILPY